jgi:myotubularin-related protein 3/4
MEFDTTKWRLTRVNVGHKLCQTYPELLIVPEKISDDQLQKIANFRSSKRFPAVVWKSKINDCVIARSSQPNVGLLAWRLAEDEQLFKLIANNCYSNNNASPIQQQQQQQQMTINKFNNNKMAFY